MTQDDVIRTSPPICALDFGVPAEFAERAESYARWAVAQEREKRTGIQEFVTLPREVVEQAMKALKSDEEMAIAFYLEISALRAALDQPDTGIPASVLDDWKLVPIEPTREMIEAGKDAHYEAEKRIQEPDAWGQGGFAKRAVRAAHVFQAMLDAAPQPPAPDQPQDNQPAMTPIAQRKLEDLMASGYTISGYSVYHEQKHQHGFVTGAGLVGWWKPEGMEYPQPQDKHEPVGEAGPMPGADGFTMACFRASDVSVGTELYTHPQPKREPLTDERIDAIADAMPGGLEGFLRGWGWRQFARAVLEATHNVK